MLGPETQRLAAGDDHLHIGARRQQLADRRRGLHHLFEVVQQEEHSLALQPLDQQIVGRHATVLEHAERVRDGRRHQLGMPDRGQRDEIHTVREIVRGVGRELQTQSTLSDAAGPDHRQETHVGLYEHLVRGGDEVAATHKWRGLHRKVVGSGIERAQRRKGCGQSGDHELEDALGALEVLEAVDAQIEDADAGGEAVAHEVAGRLRQHDLSAVSGGGDPRRAMHVHAHVARGPTGAARRCGAPSAPGRCARPASDALRVLAAPPRPRRPRHRPARRRRRRSRPRCRPRGRSTSRRPLAGSRAGRPGAWRIRRRVDAGARSSPSMSVKRSVIVPSGRGVATAQLCFRRPRLSGRSAPRSPPTSARPTARSPRPRDDSRRPR